MIYLIWIAAWLACGLVGELAERAVSVLPWSRLALSLALGPVELVLGLLILVMDWGKRVRRA